FASGFLQIPPRNGHPCLWLTLAAAGCARDFNPRDCARAGRTAKAGATDNGCTRINIFKDTLH
ncbi:MAG: hypothetical protein FWD05_11500, partial [Oscillospiraceae bacterium]|nr:hypothetical protein [Oscillospiraceae bacterium]